MLAAWNELHSKSRRIRHLDLLDVELLGLFPVHICYFKRLTEVSEEHRADSK